MNLLKYRSSSPRECRTTARGRDYSFCPNTCNGRTEKEEGLGLGLLLMMYVWRSEGFRCHALMRRWRHVFFQCEGFMISRPSSISWPVLDVQIAAVGRHGPMPLLCGLLPAAPRPRIDDHALVPRRGVRLEQDLLPSHHFFLEVTGDEGDDFLLEAARVVHRARRRRPRLVAPNMHDRVGEQPRHLPEHTRH